MPVINNPFNGKLNLDVAQYRISNGDYIDALNITKDAQGVGQDVVVSNILGNTNIPYTLPSGENKIIGFYADKVRNRAYYFLWNSNGYNSILYYNKNTNVVVKVLESKTDSDGIDILNFNPSYKVTSVNIFYRDDEGDLLFFNDGINPPKNINVTEYHGTSWKLEYILVAKAPPVMPPKVTYENDTDITINNLRNKLFQFSYRYVYVNNEKSVWSSKSIVPLPQQPTLQFTENDYFNNSRISVVFSTGGKDVRAIELAFRETTSGITSDWYLIKSINKINLLIQDNDVYYFKFYNDSIYSQLDIIETSQLQDYVPQKANASELANGNVLLYSGITEGYDKTSMNLLSYSDILNTYYYDQPGILFFASCNGQDSGTSGTELKIYIFGTGTNSVDGAVSILNNPSGEYSINAINNSGINIGATYIYNSSTPILVSTLLGNLSTELVVNGWSQVSLVGNVLTMSYPSLFTLYSSGIKYINVVGNPENTLFANAWNSGYQYGIQYFDAQGRTIGTQTTSSAAFNTPDNPSINYPQTFLQIKNRPPLEASYYQVLRSNNTTYNKRLFWISENTSRSSLSGMDLGVFNIQDFAYIGIGNITEYNKQISSTDNVVSYSFTPGDRITFLKRYDAEGVEHAITVVDYEILGVENIIIASGGDMIGTFIKIKYPIADINDNFNFNGYYDINFSHYEIFLYNLTSSADVNQRFFYEFGKCFGIGNAGTTNAYHIGLEQTQSATDPIAIPAIVSATTGDLFYRKRQVPFSDANLFNAGGQTVNIDPTIGNLRTLIILANYVNTADYTILAEGEEYAFWDDPTAYPTFADNAFFYNKSSVNIMIKVAFQVKVTSDTEISIPTLSVLQVDSTSKTFGVLSQTVSGNIASGATVTADTILKVPPNTKIWFAFGGQNVYISPFELTFNILKSKVIDIIESSFSDNYNLVTNSNGRPSVIDENARKTYFPTLIRFGGAYQVNTNINQLNNFKFENFDEYDRSFGDVIRLHIRDRYLKVYQKFKVGNVPILTQIIKDSASNPLQANTDTLINKIQYYAGDYGIGDAATSLAWNNFADYFVDNYRGVVCRLSQDGITPISITNHMNAFFAAELSAYRQDLNNGYNPNGLYTGNPCIYGVFDAYTNKYIIAMEEINRYFDCNYNGGNAVIVIPTTTTTTTTSTTSTTTSTTSTTTTTTFRPAWYILYVCADGSSTTSTSYPEGTFAIDNRVNVGSEFYTITSEVYEDPGGANLSISQTGQTGCPIFTTTTTIYIPPPLTFDISWVCDGPNADVSIFAFTGGTGFMYEYGNDVFNTYYDANANTDFTSGTSMTYYNKSFTTTGQLYAVIRDSSGTKSFQMVSPYGCT